MAAACTVIVAHLGPTGVGKLWRDGFHQWRPERDLCSEAETDTEAGETTSSKDENKLLKAEAGGREQFPQRAAGCAWLSHPESLLQCDMSSQDQGGTRGQEQHLREREGDSPHSGLATK